MAWYGARCFPKMKILLQHNHTPGEISGVKRYLDELEAELCRSGFEIRQISSKGVEWSTLVRAVEWADVVHLNSNHFRIAILARFTGKIVVLKYHFPFWARYVFGKFKRQSLLRHVLGDCIFRTRQMFPWRKGSAFALFASYGRIVGRVLVALLAHVRLAPTRFIADSADLPWLVEVNHYPMRSELKESEIFALERERELLFVGRIDQFKGLEVLIEALAILKKNESPIHLHVAGEGSELEISRTLVYELGLADCVTFHGLLNRPQVTALMRRVSALVVPSKWNDPSPLVVLEAAANGCVSIVSNMGGLPEIVGPYGLTFESESRGELAACIHRLFAEGSAKERGLATNRFLKEEFAPENVSMRLIGMINRWRVV